MVTHRLVLTAIVLASFGTACTAIVLGKLSDTGDYKTVGSSTASSSGEALGPCSLLKGRGSSSVDRDANACATCIETTCASDVQYACNYTESTSSGGSKTPNKNWFNDLQNCAQNPWNGYSPPESSSGSSSYGCKKYETPETPISDNGSDTEREPIAHNCVTTNCLQGGTPPCKMCEVHIKKSVSDSTEALLRNDDCGKCFVEKCPETLVKCCDTGGIDDFVAPCAFTKDPGNKATCLELAKAKPDAGAYKQTYYDDAGGRCLDDLKTCFTTHCTAYPGCQ